MIETNLDYQKVLAERKNKVNLAVKITAPPLNPKKENPWHSQYVWTEVVPCKDFLRKRP